MKSNQNIVKREDGKYYLTEYSLKCYAIDFSCKWVALLYAIVAAAMALLLSCPAGWVLLAAIIGAGVGAALGAAMCGDMAAIMRVWVAIKTDAQLGEHNAVANKPGVHMTCRAFGGEITYVPNVKNEFTALCLFAVNIGMTGLEGFMYAYAGRGLGMLGTARFGAFFANFGTNFLASYTMKGVAMRTLFASVGATNSYYYSKTEGSSKEEMTEGALNGGFFIEGAFYRLGTKATTGQGYEKDVYNTETGQYEKQTDWMAMSNDIAMPLSMGGIKAGTNNRDANINDVKAGAKNVLNEWSNPKQTAVSEFNKLKEQLTKTVDAAKEFRNRLKSQKKGNGAHEKASIVYRTQGGELPNASQKRIIIDENGNIKIKGDKMLYVTLDDKAHQVYFYNKRGGAGKGAEVTSFEIPEALAKEIKSNAVPQYEGKTFPNKPQISDPSKSSGAFGLPEEYIKKIEAQAIKGSGKIEQP